MLERMVVKNGQYYDGDEDRHFLCLRKDYNLLAKHREADMMKGKGKEVVMSGEHKRKG